jgi:hypothetical protein
VLLCDKLLHFARSILKSVADAEEVVSGLFINTWQKKAGFKALEKSKVANHCDDRELPFSVAVESVHQLPGGKKWNEECAGFFSTLAVNRK